MSLLALVAGVAQPARAASPTMFSPAWFAGRASAAPTAAGIGTQAGASMQAVQQSLVNLQNAAKSIAAMQSAQTQARALATAASAGAGVPNGLILGGLMPSAGAGTAGSANAWTGANLPTQAAASGRTVVTVQQTAKTASLNWQTFNVGRSTTLNFDQSAGGAAANTWVAINRVQDPTAQPSQILGQITAPGQVYVINANGIIFGGTAQVNTGALIASTAALSQSQFANFGIYSTQVNGANVPAFTGAAAPVIVQPGAVITTNQPFSVVEGGGFVMLLGSSVQNAGQISTPSGQTVLAAGQNFVVSQGYSVTGVDSQTNTPSGNIVSTTLGSQVAVTGGGAAVNTGLIQATTGDVTLVGGQVTQAGVIVSTTSVSQRGTIHLLTDQTDPTTSVTLAPGSLSYIGPDAGSTTASNAQRDSDIVDSGVRNTDSATTTADQQYQSRVEITTGGTVDFQPGSLTLANGGQVAVTAGGIATSSATPPPGRILVETGAIIDVSGLVGVSLPASANDLQVNIQPFELRDAPVNRDTTLLDSINVEVDIRQLTEVPASTAYPTGNRYYTAGGLLEVSGELGNVGHSIQEWMTLGGSVTLSTSQVVAQPGAEFNLAGGSVQYQAGYVQQSWLIGPNGQLYNVNTAPANLLYTGVFNGFTVNHPRWNVTDTFNSPLVAPSEIYESAYTVGRDAGNLIISAPSVVLEATVDAGVVNGQFQTASRAAGVTNSAFLSSALLDPFQLPQTAAPLGGSLQIGQYDSIGLETTAPTDALVGSDVAPLAASLSVATPLPASRVGTAEIPSSIVNDSGLASLTIAAGGTITVDAPLQLSPGGQVNLISPSAQISGAIRAPSATVVVANTFTPANTMTSVNAAGTPVSVFAASGLSGITLTAGGAIDTSGLWSNLQQDPNDRQDQAFINGGTVSLLTTGGLTLGAGSLIDTSSGAALTATGGEVGGAGGPITLTADATPTGASALGLLNGTAPLVLDGMLRGIGVNGGGALSVSAPAFSIAGIPQQGLPAGEAVLTPAFFQQGFSSYTLNAYGNLTDASGNALAAVTIAPGTAISVLEPVYSFTPQSVLVPTGSAPSAALTPILPALFYANPVTATLTPRLGASLSLISNTGGTGGAISMGTGSSITVDPKQSVQIETYGQITIDGSITAPAGTISVVNDTNSTMVENMSVAFQLGLSVWLGSNSVLNVSGVAMTGLDQYGRPFGEVLQGGTVDLGSTPANADQSLAATAGFVFIRPGAVIEAAGASAMIDPNAGEIVPFPGGSVAPGGARAVASNGGTIAVAAAGGIFMDGVMAAPAGGPTASGGTLSVSAPTPGLPEQTEINFAFVPVTVPDVMRVPHDIVISETQQPDQLPATLQPGDPSFSSIPGIIGPVLLSQAQIDAGGFATVSLFANDSVLFNGNVTLHAAQSVQITSGRIAETQPTGQAGIAANYVLLSGADAFLPAAVFGDGSPFLQGIFTGSLGGVGDFSSLPPCVSGAATCSGATFTVQANLIDIANSVRFGAHLSVPLNPPAVVVPGAPSPVLTVDDPGFNNVNLISSGDIRFLGSASAAASVGSDTGTLESPQAVVTSLVSPGNITLAAAQVYPVTEAVGIIAAGFDPTATSTNPYYPNASLTIVGIPGVDPAPPLSAFGSLGLYAGTINQGGILRAPEGTITLGGSTTQTADLPASLGTNSVTSVVNLLPGSITSASMAGLDIPYGGTADGVTYSYAGVPINPALLIPVGQNGPGIIVSAQSVNVEAGAVIDLSGGGELTGAAFISGRGGSVDVLTSPLPNFTSQLPGGVQSTASGTQVYAIMTGPQSYAPTTLQDQLSTGGVPSVGEQITIPAGVPGLPAGTYTLLPSYYALEPNGYRVQLTSSTNAQVTSPRIAAATVLTNGSYLVPGTVGTLNTSVQSTLPTLLTISSSAKVQDYSQYNTETFSQYVLAQAAQTGSPRSGLSIDAKALALNYPATIGTLPALTVDGTVLTQGASGGYGSWMTISATDLEITPAGATPDPNYVSLTAPALNALGAQTLVVGSGVETTTSNILPAAAQNVVLRDGAVLSAPQVFIAASGQLTLEPGSGIDTIGQPAVPAGLLDNVVYMSANGDGGSGGGGLVVLSNGQLSLSPVPGGSGAISIGGCLAGDTCSSAPVQLLTEGTLALATNGTLSLTTNVIYGAQTINITVANVNAGTDAALASANVPPGLTLSSSLLASLVAGDPAAGVPGLQTLILTANQSFNVYGDVDLSTINPATGQSSLQQFTLNTPGIYGYTTPGDPNAVATLATGTLIWNDAPNQSAIAPNPNGPGTGSGTLDIAASQIILGYPTGTAPVITSGNDRLMLGFSSVVMSAGQITVGGNGSLSVYQAQAASGTQTGGNLSLVTPLLTSQAGAVFNIAAGTAINLQAPANTAPSTVAAGALGSSLSLSAGSITDATAIVLPSGTLSMTATSGDVTLAAGSRTIMTGQTLSFFDQTQYSWGGSVALESTSGNVTEAAGALIDVSATNNDAGNLTVTAMNGTAALNGTINGGANAGFSAGTIDLRAGAVPDFVALNQALNAGGVFGTRSFDIATGDLTIGNDPVSGAPLVRAQTINVSVDSGSLTVTGTLDASGPAPGTISLAAGGNLTLAASAVLDAHGTVPQTDSQGGTIDAENTGIVNLTVSGSLPGGMLTLTPGATINVSAAPGVVCALGPCGQIALNAPRVGSDDVAVSAAGPLNILGAGSIAVNAFAIYQPTDAAGTVEQDNGGTTPVSASGAVGLNQIDTQSQAYISAALANGALAARLAGLPNYALRPGVEIESSTQSANNLTVVGSLDLSGYRYASSSGSNPLDPTVYGSGQPGVLVLRAADNLTVNGSITDGFAPPPASPDSSGVNLTSGTTTSTQLTYTLATPTDISIGSAPLPPVSAPNQGTFIFPGNTLPYAVTMLTAGSLNPGAVTPLPLTLVSSITVRVPFTTSVAFTAGGRSFAAGSQVPRNTTIAAGTTLPAGFTIPSSGAWTVGPVTLPANTNLAIFASVTIALSDGDVIPAGSTYSGSQQFNYGASGAPVYAIAPMLPAGDLSWSLQLVSGADLGAAATATLQSASALAAAASPSDPTPGSVTLNDLHTMFESSTVLPSVIRTGTGSLQIFAGGNFSEQSLFGIYTAGTQSPNVTPADAQSRPDLGSPGDAAGTNGATYNQAIADYQAYYPEAGGSLTLTAQGSVSSNPGYSTDLIGNWLFWQGPLASGTSVTSTSPSTTAWWINFGTYVDTSINGGTNNAVGFIGFTGIGALGGGNVAVAAGTNAGLLTNGAGGALDITVASTGRTDVGGLNGETLTGGGTLTLTVGGTLNGGSGVSTLNAGTLSDLRGNVSVLAGAIGAVDLTYGTTLSSDPRAALPNVAEAGTGANGPVLVIGDGSATLSALGDVVLGGAGDATRETQQYAPDGNSWFSLWQPTTSITLFSAGGNVAPIVEQTSDPQGNNLPTDARYLYPPILNVTAASGSIYLTAGLASELSVNPTTALELAPSAQGQASFLAAQSIYDQGGEYNPNDGGNGTLELPLAVDISGADPTLLPTPLNPAFAYASVNGASNVDPNAHTSPDALFALEPDTLTGNIHASDPTAALFYAVSGDIVGFTTGEQVTLPTTIWYIAGKPVRIIAGRDIVGLGVPSQLPYAIATNDTSGSVTAGSLFYNASPTDVSEVIAGRDIIDANVSIGGPGSLYVQTGRNLEQDVEVNASFQPSGETAIAENFVFASIGPLVNVSAATRDGGADITTLIGVGAAGPDWASFANLYLNPANLANATTPLQNQPGKVERTYQTELLAFLQQTYGYAGDAAGALAFFEALPIEQQRDFLLTIYFAELNQSGLDFNDPTSRFSKSYLEGDAAAAALFPQNVAQPSVDTGDATVIGGSGITTQFGGDLNVLAPGGAITLGITSNAQPPSTSGLLTQGSGNVNVYANGSVELGQSRIFTTFGGGILIWSAGGNINAGRGAKSTVVFAPEQITYDDQGDVLLSPTVPTTGAGIATLAPIAKVPPGNVNLVAPLGVIDAGEAGIRSSGNANLAALEVLNAANIQVQGKVTGLPVIAVPNVAAETAASTAAGAAQQAAQAMAGGPRQNLLPSIYLVEVVGFGGGDGADTSDSQRRRIPSR